MNKEYFEVVGRFGVLLTMIIIMNRTEWYQNLPLQTLTNASFYVWMFCFGLVLSLAWVIIPIIKFTPQKHGE